MLGLVLAVLLTGCGSDMKTQVPTGYIFNDEAPEVLILMLVGAEGDTATGKVVSQDDKTVVVWAEMTQTGSDNGTLGGFNVWAPVVLDRQLGTRKVVDASGSEIPRYPPSG